MKTRTILLYVLCMLTFAPVAHASVINKTPNNLGLVAYWSFNEGTSTILHDFSGNRNNGTLSGGTWVPGKLGKALSFNGTSDKVTGGSIKVGATMTISAWIYKNSSTAQRSFFSNRAAGGTTYFGLSGTQIFLFDNAGTPNSFKSSSGVVQMGQWQHIVATSDGATTMFYINGVFATSTPQVRTGSTGTFGIGWDPSIGTEFWDGKIDEVRVYNRALSATEITALYQAGAVKLSAQPNAGTLANGLVGWWTMDGVDVTDKVYDRSGQGNNGYVGGIVATSSMKTIGKLGQALNFKGSGYVDVGSTTVLNGATAFTVAAWVKPNALPFPAHQGIFGRGSNVSSNRTPWLWGNATFSNTCMQFMTTIGGAADGSRCATINLIAGVWNHVVYTWDGTTLTAYINAVSAGTDTTVGHVLSDVDTTTYIGYINGYAKWAGPIDDVRIYNRALSATEVKQLYNQGLGTVANKSSATLQNGSSLVSGLVGLWTFDGSTINWKTNTANDLSGQGNTGTLVGMSTSTSAVIGKLGQALNFNGSTNNYINVPSSSSLNLTNAITLSTWVKLNAYGSEPELLNKGLNYRLSVTTSGGNKAVFTINDGANHPVYGGTVIALSKWYLITGTYDGSNLRIYVNGILDNAPAAISSAAVTNGNNVFIGGLSGYSRWVNGTLDDVRIYNRALSASEVQHLYNMGK